MVIDLESAARISLDPLPLDFDCMLRTCTSSALDEDRCDVEILLVHELQSWSIETLAALDTLLGHVSFDCLKSSLLQLVHFRSVAQLACYGFRPSCTCLWFCMWIDETHQMLISESGKFFLGKYHASSYYSGHPNECLIMFVQVLYNLIRHVPDWQSAGGCHALPLSSRWGLHQQPAAQTVVC